MLQKSNSAILLKQGAIITYCQLVMHSKMADYIIKSVNSLAISNDWAVSFQLGNSPSKEKRGCSVGLGLLLYHDYQIIINCKKK